MTSQGTSVRSLRVLVAQTLSISTLLGLAFLSPALADDDDDGGKAGNVIKAADVGVKVVGGLATWIQGQGDDCSVAGAVGVSGCECGFQKEECQDTGWHWASTDECDGSDPEISNACGTATAHAYASEALAGSWAGRKTVVTVNASATPVECGTNSAYAWGTAKVDGTILTREDSTVRPSQKATATPEGGIAWKVPQTIYGGASVWPDDTILAVIDFENFGLVAGEEMTTPTEFGGTLIIDDNVLWTAFASLNSSGILTVSGDLSASDFDVSFDRAERQWVATYLADAVEIPLGRQGADEQQFDFVYEGTSTTDPGFVFNGIVEYEPASGCCEGDILEHEQYPHEYSWNGATSTALQYSAAPNPFRGTTDIRFSLEAASHARVDIYDVSGRHVRGLFDGPVSAGTHTTSWDGTSDLSEPVDAGVYYSILTVGDQSLRTRIVRVK